MQCNDDCWEVEKERKEYWICGGLNKTERMQLCLTSRHSGVSGTPLSLSLSSHSSVFLKRKPIRIFCFQFLLYLFSVTFEKLYYVYLQLHACLSWNVHMQAYLQRLKVTM